MMDGLLTLEKEMSRYAIDPIWDVVGSKRLPLCLTGLFTESGQPNDNHAISSQFLLFQMYIPFIQIAYLREQSAPLR